MPMVMSLLHAGQKRATLSCMDEPMTTLNWSPALFSCSRSARATDPWPVARMAFPRTWHGGCSGCGCHESLAIWCFPTRGDRSRCRHLNLHEGLVRRARGALW